MVIMPRLRLYSSFLLLLRHVASQKTDLDYSGEGKPFNPSMGIVIVTITLVILFFALVFVSVYMRRLQEQARGIDSIDPGNSPNVRRQATRGLDASVIETFPTFRYSTEKTMMIRKEALECPVCLEEFEEDEMLRLIPQCCHAFHLSCVDAWLRSHATCPLCRTNLVHVLGESISFDIPTCPLSSVYLVPVPGESASYDIPVLAKEAGQNSGGISIDDDIQQTEQTT